MNPLRQMSYEEFGKLRFLDFFPKTEHYSEDYDGGVDAGIGLAATEGYSIDAAFASPIDVDWQTAEIVLDFEGVCPEAEAHTLLDQLGLPLRKGMSVGQVTDILGAPDEKNPWRFIVGSSWSYYVGCSVDEIRGLFSIWICRKDLADAQERIESGHVA